MPRGKKIDNPMDLARREPYRSIIQIIGHIGRRKEQARTQEAITKALTRYFPCPDWTWLRKEIGRLENRMPITKMKRTKTSPQRVYGYLKKLLECGLLTRERVNDVGSVYDLSCGFSDLSLIEDHIERLQKTDLNLVLFFPSEHTTIYSGWPVLTKPAFERVLEHVKVIQKAADQICSIQDKFVDALLEDALKNIKNSCLPERFKEWIDGVFSNVTMIPYNRYCWWDDMSGATEILLDKAVAKLEEMGEPQSEMEPIYISEYLLDHDNDMPKPEKHSAFASAFDDDDLCILWLIRRFFGDFWEWNIGTFGVLDSDERITATEREKAQQPLSKGELKTLCDFFQKHDVSKELLYELRELYRLVGEGFAPHIVVGPLWHQRDVDKDIIESIRSSEQQHPEHTPDDDESREEKED